MFLKILSMVDEEIANAMYASSRRSGDARINTEIKDRIREYDIDKITRFLFEIMTTFQNDSDHEDLVRQCLVVVGQWIGDISCYVC
jgi:exportin-T